MSVRKQAVVWSLFSVIILHVSSHIWQENPESILKHDLDSEEYLGVEYCAQFAQTWLPLGTVVQWESVSRYLQGSDLWNIVELGKLR